MGEGGRRLTIYDCWSAAEIPIHRGLLTIVSQLRGRREQKQIAQSSKLKAQSAGSSICWGQTKPSLLVICWGRHLLGSDQAKDLILQIKCLKYSPFWPLKPPF